MLEYNSLVNFYRMNGYNIRPLPVPHCMAAVPAARNGHSTVVILYDRPEVSPVLTAEYTEVLERCAGCEPGFPRPESTSYLFVCHDKSGKQKPVGANTIVVNADGFTLKSHITDAALAGEKDFAYRLIGKVSRKAEMHKLDFGGITKNHKVITTYLLILVNVALFLLYRDDVSQFGISREAVSGGNISAIMTYMFFHAGLFHLLGNMAALYICGAAFERRCGAVMTASVYLLSGIYGAGLSLLVNSGSTVTVGASGAIFGILGGLLAMSAVRKGSGMSSRRVFFCILFLLVSSMSGTTDNFCHIGGIIGGFIYTMLFLVLQDACSEERRAGLHHYFSEAGRGKAV